MQVYLYRSHIDQGEKEYTKIEEGDISIRHTGRSLNCVGTHIEELANYIYPETIDVCL